MKYSELRTLIKEEIKKIMIIKEDDEEDGRPKSTSQLLGLKKERYVIDGNSVKENQDKIIKLIKNLDKSSTMTFFPATGKIVGVMLQSKFQQVKKELAKIDKNIHMISKPQTLK